MQAELSQIIEPSNYTSSHSHLSNRMKAQAERSVDALAQTMLNLNLNRAIHRRDVYGEEGVVALIKKGASIKALDLQSESPIHIALSMKVASEIHLPMVKMLCEYGADVTKPDHMGWTPLMTVVKSGSMPLVMLIYRHGNRRDLGSINGVKESCLHIACHIRSYDIVRFLIARMSEFGVSRCNINGKNAFHIAAQNGSLNILQCLRKGDARMKFTLLREDNRGWTPLHWAIFSGHVDIIRYLYVKCKVPDMSEEETNRLERLGIERASSYSESGTICMGTVVEREAAQMYIKKRRMMKKKKKELFDLPPTPPKIEEKKTEEDNNDHGVAYQRKKKK